MSDFVLVDGPIQVLEAAVEERRRAGWAIRHGFDGGGSAASAVRVGSVAGPEDAGAALLAAIRGDALIVHLQVGGEVLERFVEDLRHVGTVEFRAEMTAAPADPLGSLSEDQRCLLDLLARGSTLDAAAKELHLSRRTAARRMASARERLGVGTTAEAVMAARTGGAGVTSHP